MSIIPNLNLLTFGIIFWSGHRNCIQSSEKCIRVIKGVNKRVSCRSIFGEFKILTITSLYCDMWCSRNSTKQR
jgi:hypothetical protein